MSHNAVLLKIKALSPSLSEKEKKIAELILEEPRTVSRMTINEIATELGMADSTVFKFTRKLGYRGFREFRTDLLSEEFNPQVSVNENVTDKDGMRAVAEKIFAASASSLTNTLALLDEKDLERAVGYIVMARRVSFYGCGESGVVALDSYQKFLRAPIFAQCVNDTHMQVMQAAKLDEHDVAFVFSHTGRSKEMYAAAKLAHECGAKVILITSYPSQMISEFADITFVSTSEETGYRPESLACRYAQMAIIDTLYVAAMFRLEGSADSIRKIRHGISYIKDV